MLLVKHMMAQNVVTVKSYITVKKTIETLFHKHVGCVLSVDNNKKCNGIFTERDAIRIVAENVTLDQPLSNVMTKNVITIQEDASINEARRVILAHRIRHIPVINKKDKLVGLLSVRKILDMFYGLDFQNE